MDREPPATTGAVTAWACICDRLLPANCRGQEAPGWVPHWREGARPRPSETAKSRPTRVELGGQEGRPRLPPLLEILRGIERRR